MILIKLSNLLLGARQHHTTSGSVLFFALAAHGRKVRKPAVPGSTPGKKKTVSPLYSMSVLFWVSMKSGLSFQSQRTSSSDMPFHHHDYHHQIYNRACSLNLDVWFSMETVIIMITIIISAIARALQTLHKGNKGLLWLGSLPPAAAPPAWEPWRNTRSPGDWSHTIQALFTGCKDLFYIHIHVQVYICIFLHKHMYKSIYMVYTNAIHM